MIKLDHQHYSSKHFKKISGNFDKYEFSLLVKKSYEMALSLDHKLSSDLLEAEGMSGRKYRYFINNLIGLMENPRYLEVGSWKGSTACAAMYLNKCKVTCIDNWSEFNGPHLERDQFDGINLALPALDQTFILIVDDWNWPAPRKGTFDALSEADITISHSIEIFTCTEIENPENKPYLYFENSDWHNGYLIAVCHQSLLKK